MLKRFSLLSTLLVFMLANHTAKAQGFKFGVHVAPVISLMGSDYKQVENKAVNVGLNVGVEVEYYLAEGENYAITFGLDFALNKGGTLLYKYGGTLMPISELDRNTFADASGTSPTDGTNVDMQAFTRINYRVNYLELPIGLKLRTNELGSSYMRAFFHLPIVKIGVPVNASASIYAPDSNEEDYVADIYGYAIKSNESPSKEPNVWKDATPIQFSIGMGAGVEYAPNADGGLRLFAGLYYDAGLIDITNGFTGDKVRLREPNTALGSSGEVKRNPTNMLHNIALRVGVTF